MEEQGALHISALCRHLMNLAFILMLFQVRVPGAIVGALYADGYPPREIMKLMNTKSGFDYFSPTVPRGGLLKISGVIRILKSNLRARTFEELKIPLFVTATDLNNGKAVYFSSGDLLRAVIASSSIPVLFRPMIIDDIQYV